MAEDRGASPGSQPAEPPVSPAATPPPVLSQTQDPKFTEALSKATSVEEIRALTERAKSGEFKTAEPAPAAPPAEPKPGEDPTPPAEPAAEPAEPGEPKEPKPGEEPAEPEEPPAEPTAEPTPEPKDEDEDEPEGDEINPSKAKKIRLGLPESDEVGRLAATYQRRNRDWTLEQALAAAKEKLGVKPEPAAEPSAEPRAPVVDDGLPKTVAEVDVAIEALEDAKAKAADELNVTESAKIDRQLRKLDHKRSDLIRDGERQAVVQHQREAARYTTAFNESNTRAVDLYAFASDPASPGGKRLVEIDRQLEENKDPLFGNPNKPLIIAQMVATELKIAPRSKRPPVVPAKAPVPAVPPKSPKQVLPGGGSRTAPTTVSVPTARATEIASVKSEADLRKLHASLGIGS